jgi:predicted permease
MRTIWQDVRHAFRGLYRSPGFVGVAVLTLALGIGANTAVFSVFEQVLLRSLPVRDPGSLVTLVTEGKYIGGSWGMHMLSYPMFKDLQNRDGVFSGVLCWRPDIAALDDGRGAEKVAVELVSAGYFDVLGVPPALGRTFVAEDETAPGANPVIVLTHDFWRTRYGRDPNVVGRTVLINGWPLLVVGVAARGFRSVSLDFHPAMFLPITMKQLISPGWGNWENRRMQWVRVSARLKPGFSRAQAEAALQTPYRQIIEQETREPGFPAVSPAEREQFLQSRLSLLPGGRGDSFLSSDLREPLSRLMILAALVLLVACVNVANLLTARGMSRRKEVTVRLAMGAGRLRLMRQMLIESLMLAVAGGLTGLLLSVWATRLLPLVAPGQLRSLISPGINGIVLIFSVIVSGVAAVLFGLLPAWRATRISLASTFNEQATAVVGGPGVRLRQGMVVVQVGLSLILLVGSGLLVRSLASLYSVERGFQPTNLVRFKLDPAQRIRNWQRRLAFCERLLRDLQTVPGVRSVAVARVPLLESYAWGDGVVVEGYQTEEGEHPMTTCDSVSRDYCKTLGIPLRLGRDFTEQDELPGAPLVVIVNETFVRTYLQGRNPLGCRVGFRHGPDFQPDREIVGVVADFKSDSLRWVRPLMMGPYPQMGLYEMTVYVRTSSPSAQLFPAIREQVLRIDSGIPIYDFGTVENQLDRYLATERLMGFLASLFGALATVLAMIGLYGVMTYNVARRVREIGIRMALGAEPGSVLGLILRDGMLLVGLGAALGLAGAVAVTHILRNLLFGIGTTDPLTYAGAAVLLIVVALLACYLPARRAARIDPMAALRHE